MAQRSANVGPLEGALGGADFDEFLGREDNAAGAVEAEVVAGGGVAGLDYFSVLEGKGDVYG